jgi:hypothetical protein
VVPFLVLPRRDHLSAQGAVKNLHGSGVERVFWGSLAFHSYREDEKGVKRGKDFPRTT